MRIGALGNIPFYVSDGAMQTVTDVQWRSGARFAEHERHGQKDLLEKVGAEADEISFSMQLSAFLGVNPVTILDQLNAMMTSGEPHRLVLGTKTVGKLWVITDLDRALERFYKDGDLLEATVDVKMKEYEELAQMPIIANRLSFVDRMVSMPRVIPSPLPDVTKPIVQPTAKKVTVSAKPVSKPTAKPAARAPYTKPDFVKADIAKNRSYNNTKTRTSVVVTGSASRPLPVKTRMTK